MIHFSLLTRVVLIKCLTYRYLPLPIPRISTDIYRFRIPEKLVPDCWVIYFIFILILLYDLYLRVSWVATELFHLCQFRRTEDDFLMNAQIYLPCLVLSFCSYPFISIYGRTESNLLNISLCKEKLVADGCFYQIHFNLILLDVNILKSSVGCH